MIIVQVFENSGTNIKSIALTKINVSRRNQKVPIKFRRIKMYGTPYNYNGYGLDAKKKDGACVPRHFLETYNNQDVTNPSNKISKLDMPKLLETLRTKDLYEGCSIEQIANFCNRYNITYYVMNFINYLKRILTLKIIGIIKL